ncbi:MAG: hypothetical protein HYX86_01935 [Chloroflexi bacterium]|nr:hypothetical protein [Chloroflexota bacterium]
MAVGRFQVMAVLQAARAHVLGLPVDSAKSFGLNRAIFYAAAKRGFKGGRPPQFRPKALEEQKISDKELKKIKDSYGVHRLGDEIAYKVEIKGKPIFTIGDELQTPERFEKQVASRFGKQYQKAWKQAVKIVRGFDKGVLLSQRYFYETVYKPRRDELATEWSEMVEEE